MPKLDPDAKISTYTIIFLKIATLYITDQEGQN